MLANVQALAPHLEARLQELLEIPIVREVRGMGFFWAVELAKDGAELAFDADEREQLLRGFMPQALLEAGIIARADDRGDAVVQIAPPLVSDAALLDEIVDALQQVLTRASEHMGVAASAAAS